MPTLLIMSFERSIWENLLAAEVCPPALELKGLKKAIETRVISKRSHHRLRLLAPWAALVGLQTLVNALLAKNWFFTRHAVLRVSGLEHEFEAYHACSQVLVVLDLLPIDDELIIGEGLLGYHRLWLYLSLHAHLAQAHRHTIRAEAHFVVVVWALQEALLHYFLVLLLLLVWRICTDEGSLGLSEDVGVHCCRVEVRFCPWLKFLWETRVLWILVIIRRTVSNVSLIILVILHLSRSSTNLRPLIISPLLLVLFYQHRCLHLWVHPHDHGRSNAFLRDIYPHGPFGLLLHNTCGVLGSSH